jgi:flagellar biosynthesis protein FlhF
MQVKRFVAADMRRALELVRQEMGPEAIILSSQRTSEGVEIITSIETDLPTRGIDERRQFEQKFERELDRPLPSDAAWETQAGLEQAVTQFPGSRVENTAQRSGEDIAREIEKARERMLAAKRKSESFQRPKPHLAQTAGERYGLDDDLPAQSGFGHTQAQKLAEAVQRAQQEGRKDPDERRLDELQNELADMRLMLEQQLWRMAEHQGQSAPSFTGQSQSHSALMDHLERLGLPRDLVAELVRQVKPNQRLSLAWREVLARLARQLPADNSDLIDRGGVFAFVGPTGVGKTTTIAKLAARYVLEHGPGKVALVTTDTFRVGAHDQLRSLGRILNVPVRVVDRERSMAAVLASLKDFPLVLVDTAGFRHGDPLLRDQLQMLDSCPTVERILVLACNSQLQSLKASVHAYASGHLSGCILTKLDETASLGEALSVVLRQGIPVTYTTDGQDIPRDIAVATGHALVAKAVALMKSQRESQDFGGAMI